MISLHPVTGFPFLPVLLSQRPDAGETSFYNGITEGTTMTTEELRAKFARKANLTDEHHDALVKLEPTPAVVLWDMGTEQPVR